MPSTRDPDALKDLIDEIDDPDIGARKVERWRQHGWMPDPIEQQRLGRRGTRSIYPPWAADQARALGRLVKRGQAVDAVTLPLYGSGRWVSDRALLDAYRARLGRDAERREQALAAADGDPLQAAEGLAHSARIPGTVRTRCASLGGAYEEAKVTTSDRLHSIVTCAIHAQMTGRPTYEQALQESIDFGGVTAFSEHLPGPVAQEDVVDATGQNLNALATATLTEVVEEVTRDELDRARGQARFFAQVFAGILQITDQQIAQLALIGAALNRKLAADRDTGRDSWPSLEAWLSISR